MKEALEAILKTTPDSKYLLRQMAYVKGCTIATDGHRFLAVRQKLAKPPTGQYPNFPDDWLAYDGTRGVEVSALELLKFIGKSGPTCENCDGDGVVTRECGHCGQHEHQYTCNECYGAGITKRPVHIGPALVNANLLSDVLPLLNLEGTVRIEATDEVSRVSILATEWVCAVMPMRKQGVESPETKPRFEVVKQKEVSQ